MAKAAVRITTTPEGRVIQIKFGDGPWKPFGKAA
jgi:hypothetical protein